MNITTIRPVPKETKGLSDGAIAGIVIAVLALSALVVFCCRRCFKRDVRERLISGPATKVVIVKRCEQDSVRDVENRILQMARLQEKTWRPHVDYGLAPVLVFCVGSSRIGTDIDSALEGVNTYGNVILVVLHIKHSTQLRGDLADCEYLLDTQLRDRFGKRIVHFAFSEQERFYNCIQNNQGFEKISALTAQ